MDLKAAVNAAIAQARTLPATISTVEQIAPDLASALEAKPLVQSRSPLGTLAAAALGYVSARYGLGLDEHSVELVTGAALLGGSYAMRAITSRPIAGVVGKPAA